MTVRLPRDIHDRLRKLAFDTREHMNGIVVEGVRRELDRRADGAKQDR